MEAMYLGTNESGCELAAVTKSTDRPFGHKYLYGKNDLYSTTNNFKKCGANPTEFNGESLERTFPQAIENEYNRVYNICKVRGSSMSSNLGYNIDCQRIGEPMKPIYEMTVTKKDRLVFRALEQ